MTDPYQTPGSGGPAIPPATAPGGVAPGFSQQPGYGPGGSGYPHPPEGSPYSPAPPYPGGPSQYPGSPPQYPGSPPQYQPPQQYPPYGANPYGPPQGYPGYPQPQAPAPRGSRAPLIIVLVIVGVLALVGGGIGLVALVRSGSDSAPTVAPKATVDAFLTAVFQDNDTAGALTKVCDGEKSAIQTKIDSVNQVTTQGTVTVAWDQLREEIHGKQAAVSASASVKVSGSSDDFNPNLVALWFFNLSIEHGEWKICGWV